MALSKITAIAAAGILVVGTAHAAEHHTITGIAGNHIELDDGTIYSTDDDISAWNRGDSVIVTDDGDKMIHDEDEIDVEQE